MPHCDKLVLICCLPPSLSFFVPFARLSVNFVMPLRDSARRLQTWRMQADCYETILCLKYDCKRLLGKLEVVVEVCLPILWFLWLIFRFIIKNASYITLKHTLRTHSIVAAARLSVFFCLFSDMLLLFRFCCCFSLPRQYQLNKKTKKKTYIYSRCVWLSRQQFLVQLLHGVQLLHTHGVFFTQIYYYFIHFSSSSFLFAVCILPVSL